MKKSILYFSLLAMFCFVPAKLIFACDTCSCSLARINSDEKRDKNQTPVFFDFTFEQKVWHQRDVALAHALHHQGHDSHDKLREEVYHFNLGGNWGRTSMLVDLPYVVRHFLEVDSHEALGQRQRTEGFGDLNLNVIYKLLKSKNDFWGPVAGIKLPTGGTREKNAEGNKVEPELQPGSGSFDPSAGMAFQYTLGQFQWHGNAIYTIRTRGAQEFEFGNLFSTYFHMGYLLNPKSPYLNTRLGIDSVLQNEQKQRDRNGPLADSGGTTWLLGPEISIQGNRRISLFGNILFPIYQNLGGIHQLVQFVWNAGVKISF